MKSGAGILKAGACMAALFCIFIAGSGCGKKEADEPTKYMSQDGLEKLTMEAAGKQAQAGGTGANNPAYLTAVDRKPHAADVATLDGVIRPVLTRMFGGAKLVDEGGREEKPDDVILNSFTYVPQKAVRREDGDPLHAAFVAENFGPSIRLGTKPTCQKAYICMSFYKHVNKKQYSLAIFIDIPKRTIKVTSYRPGSKYDRLM